MSCSFFFYQLFFKNWGFLKQGEVNKLFGVRWWLYSTVAWVSCFVTACICGMRLHGCVQYFDTSAGGFELLLVCFKLYGLWSNGVRCTPNSRHAMHVFSSCDVYFINDDSYYLCSVPLASCEMYGNKILNIFSVNKAPVYHVIFYVLFYSMPFFSIWVAIFLLEAQLHTACSMLSCPVIVLVKLLKNSILEWRVM